MPLPAVVTSTKAYATGAITDELPEGTAGPQDVPPAPSLVRTSPLLPVDDGKVTPDKVAVPVTSISVSYTHLTLPTILRV